MSIILGLLGPIDSVEVVQQFLKKFNDIIFIPIEFLTEEDLNQRVLPRKNEITMWLCTGPITYDRVQKWGKIFDPIFHNRYNGITINSVFLKLSHDH